MGVALATETVVRSSPFPPDAVMRAVPPATPTTMPLRETPATPGLLLLQRTDRLRFTGVN